MADKDDDEFKHDDQFPPNVNPSKANRKAFSDQMEKDRKALEDGNPEDVTEERIGEGIREIPTDEREPEASPPGKSQVRQNKTVSK